MAMSKEYLAEENGSVSEELVVEEAPSLLADFLRTFLVLALLFAGAVLLLNYVGQRVSVEGSSMQPSLVEGDQLLVNKISYRLGEPERCDIVVFRLKDDPGTYYIKRIIGMPGETIQLINGEIYIDGQCMQEDYGLEPIQDAGMAAEPVTLGADEYFVLGDNRNDSRDSRSQELGPIKREQLMGKIFIRIWPFSEWGYVR